MHPGPRPLVGPECRPQRCEPEGRPNLHLATSPARVRCATVTVYRRCRESSPRRWHSTGLPTGGILVATSGKTRRELLRFPPGLTIRPSAFTSGRGSLPATGHSVSAVQAQSKASSSKERFPMSPYWNETCAASLLLLAISSACARCSDEISIPVTIPSGDTASVSHSVWVPIPHPASRPRLPTGSWRVRIAERITGSVTWCIQDTISR